MIHQNPDVERFVIGALLDSDGVAARRDNRALLAGLSLAPDDFTDRRMRVFFGAICSLVEAGTPVDPETVTGASKPFLRESPHQELLTLRGSNTATMGILSTHAATLRRLSALRRLAAHYRAQLAAMDGARADPGKLMHLSSSFLGTEAAGLSEGDESGGVDVSELADEWGAFIDGKREPYLRTHIEALDAEFNGFVPNLNLIGGRASVGKTALIAEMLMNWLKQKIPVGLFGLEDGTAWLLKRHLSRALGIPYGAVGATRLNDELWDTYAKEMQDMQNLFDEKLHVYRKGGIASGRMLAIARRWIYVNGVRAIVIDHGGEIRHENASARDRYDLAVRNSMEGLRDLAIQTKTPVIVLWHLNREGAKAGQPTMEAFKESGYLEAMARTMLGLWERPERNPNQLLVTVVKATNGRRDVTVALDKDFVHGLVHSRGGRTLDLQAEARTEQREASSSSKEKAQKLLRRIGGLAP
jgi:replicative DNA helicase